MIMDDDLITRTLSVEGEVVALAQSPRKRRHIIELDHQGGREVAWGKGKEVQGFITNPYEDERDVFGARFVDESHFVCFIERPDELFELREGSFDRARGVQLRRVGAPLRSPPLPPVPFDHATRALLFKYIDHAGERGYLPVSRHIAGGEERVVGELISKPRASSASREAEVVSWVDEEGRVWVSSPRLPMRQIGESAGDLLAVSHDGDQVAWCDRGALVAYSLRRRQAQRWHLKQPPLALAWRSESF
jgi:hypothetical protein